MIDKNKALPVKRQCELLAVARSTAYYQPVPLSEENLRIARTIDEIHLDKPFLGSRRMIDELAKLGLLVNRKRVQRLMIDGHHRLVPEA
jgi:putative transposase